MSRKPRYVPDGPAFRSDVEAFGRAPGHMARNFVKRKKKVEWGEALRVGVTSRGLSHDQRDMLYAALIANAERTLPPGTRYVIKEEAEPTLSPTGFTLGACWYRHVDMDKEPKWIEVSFVDEAKAYQITRRTTRPKP